MFELRIEIIVGQNVARLRGQRNPPTSQPAFGEEIGRITGKPWSRQAVSNAELGARAFSVADLVLLAMVLEVHPAALLTIPVTEATQNVELGSVSVRRDELVNPNWQRGSTTQAMGELVGVLGRMHTSLNALSNFTDPLERASADLSGLAIRLQGDMRVEERGGPRLEEFEAENLRLSKKVQRRARKQI